MSKKGLDDLLIALRDLEYEEDEKLGVIEAVVETYDLRTDDCDSCGYNTVVLIDDYPYCLNCGKKFNEWEFAECKECDGKGIIKPVNDPDHDLGETATCLKCGEEIPPYECEVCGVRGYDGFEFVQWYNDDAPNGGYVALCQYHAEAPED